jgi:hypothetical protein
MSPGRRRAAFLATARTILAGLVLAAGSAVSPATAQWKATPPSSPSDSPFGVLQGRWVRPDGGYTITIRGVDAAGRIDAAYANPNPLPFSKAEARRDGSTLKLFLELRAGGYNGSTYTLDYDAANDVLRGVYFQAVAQQQFNVTFVRVR